MWAVWFVFYISDVSLNCHYFVSPNWPSSSPQILSSVLLIVALSSPCKESCLCNRTQEFLFSEIIFLFLRIRSRISQPAAGACQWQGCQPRPPWWGSQTTRCASPPPRTSSLLSEILHPYHPVLPHHVSHNPSLRNIVEEDEVTKHGNEADKPKPSHNIDDCVFKIKLPWYEG